MLDLSGVSYMDSTGLGEVITAYSSIQARGGCVVLLSPSTRTEELLQIVKLATVFDMYVAEADAIDALERRVARGTPPVSSRP